MPASVFLVGCGIGTESFSLSVAANMAVVTTGVAIASYGEINFVLIGVLLQLAAIAAEATRLSLVQVCSAETEVKHGSVILSLDVCPSVHSVNVGICPYVCLSLELTGSSCHSCRPEL